MKMCLAALRAVLSAAIGLLAAIKASTPEFVVCAAPLPTHLLKRVTSQIRSRLHLESRLIMAGLTKLRGKAGHRKPSPLLPLGTC